jgi:hypothetical protein
MTSIAHPVKGRFEELLVDSHVNQAVDRALEALTLTTGTLNCPLREDLLRDVANAVSILEVNPDHNMIHGLCLVTRGPMEGWRVYVPAADVFRMRLDTFFRDIKEQK